MKRRGFLGLLLAAPLAPVAAKAVISEKPATSAYTFTNDPGLYRAGAGFVQFAIGGRNVKVPYFDK